MGFPFGFNDVVIFYVSSKITYLRFIYNRFIMMNLLLSIIEDFCKNTHKYGILECYLCAVVLNLILGVYVMLHSCNISIDERREESCFIYEI